MGFNSSFRADARGFKGGVWIVWDPLVVNLTILDFGDQFIHAEGCLVDGSKYFITTVYASPRPTRRVLLWDKLKLLSVGAELTQNLENLTSRLKKWNKEVFGNIFKRKQRLVDQLRSAEACSISNPSDANRAAEEAIRAKLELTLWQEEALWIQKSRAKWVVEGDRNTHFFHMSALKRRAFNRIKRLKDGSDIWIDDQEMLARMATDHFKVFYSGTTSQFGRLIGKIRNFIWGSTEGTRKIHNVNWQTVCKPKCLGGLGLRSARDLNRAFLMKIVWGLLSKPTDLWAQVLLTKYMIRTDEGWRHKRQSGFSAAWRGMLSVWGDTTNGLQWSIRDGRRTKFWTNIWLDSGATLIDFASNIQGVNPLCSVSDFCLPDGSWDFQRLSCCLPPEIILQIGGMTPPRAGAGEDVLVWGLEDNGRFSVKSAYALLRDYRLDDRNGKWQKVWQW
ncbi:Putative ribonuclease H protein At1g65750 [Linum perenne]